MSDSEAFQENEVNASSEPALSESKSKEGSRLSVMAWIIVALTVVFAVVSLWHNPTIAWIFIGMAIISVLCSLLALKKGSGKGGKLGLALLLSLALLGFSAVNLLGLKSHDFSISHNRNQTTLSSLELMLENYYEKNGKFPAALTELTEEVKIFPDAKVEHFMSYTIPATEEEKNWNYIRTSEKECSLKADAYKFKGSEVTLSLSGSGGQVGVAGTE